jgi:MoaA/NifB/PqqE/SkfB family radical SAM enzyme
MTSENPPVIVAGIKARWITVRMWFQLLKLALREYRSVKKAWKALSSLLILRKKFAGENDTVKMIKNNGRYYWNLHIPGFPSKGFDRQFLGGLNRRVPVRSFYNRLSILFLGITSRCPLNCRHCYDWTPLKQEDTLSVDELQAILLKYLENGIGQVTFLGGEPMARFDDLLQLIKVVGDQAETWFSTSGYQLDREKAFLLKEAGLTGVWISIDHYDKQKHNAIRGHDHAFDWAIEATQNAVNAGLLTCWSLCLTPEMVDLKELTAYANLAASRHVNFINILEPMAKGRYCGKDVAIDPAGLKILEEFLLKTNTDPSNSNLPLIIYDGYFSRRLGCLGAGNRYVYIDSRGNLHPCPFCRSEKKMNAMDGPVKLLLEEMQLKGCLVNHPDDRFQ